MINIFWYSIDGLRIKFCTRQFQLMIESCHLYVTWMFKPLVQKMSLADIATYKQIDFEKVFVNMFKSRQSDSDLYSHSSFSHQCFHCILKSSRWSCGNYYYSEKINEFVFLDFNILLSISWLHWWKCLQTIFNIIEWNNYFRKFYFFVQTKKYPLFRIIECGKSIEFTKFNSVINLNVLKWLEQFTDCKSVKIFEDSEFRWGS